MKMLKILCLQISLVLNTPLLKFPGYGPDSGAQNLNWGNSKISIKTKDGDSKYGKLHNAKNKLKMVGIPTLSRLV